MLGRLDEDIEQEGGSEEECKTFKHVRFYEENDLLWL